jgi:SAM-dependent methyltransferase
VNLVPKDVILLPESSSARPDRWVAMNVFARSCLGLSGEVVHALGCLDDAPFVAEKSFLCWDIERFSNEDGLLADPSRFVRDTAQWAELRLDGTALLDKLKKHAIVVDDEAAYRARFQPKRNLLDYTNFGNFHQQHGQHLTLKRRDDPAAWWMRQKFAPDYLSVRPETLYGAVQWKSLEEYAAQRMKPGTEVIDLGCGTGIYCNLLARHGASVLGIDPSEEYLAVARSNAAPGTRFLNMRVGQAGGLDEIPSSSADMVFMSDALLFYFVPFYPGQQADIGILLADIRRILKPGGVFVSLEPHAAFYLTPWLGAVDRPFTVATEYLHKHFGVVPPLSKMIGALTEAGFAVTAMRELGPHDYFKDIDPRGYHFAREFPLWQLLELRKFAS